MVETRREDSYDSYWPGIDPKSIHLFVYETSLVYNHTCTYHTIFSVWFIYRSSSLWKMTCIMMAYHCCPRKGAYFPTLITHHLLELPKTSVIDFLHQIGVCADRTAAYKNMNSFSSAMDSWLLIDLLHPHAIYDPIIAVGKCCSYLLSILTIYVSF